MHFYVLLLHTAGSTTKLASTAHKFLPLYTLLFRRLSKLLHGHAGMTASAAGDPKEPQSGEIEPMPSLSPRGITLGLERITSLLSSLHNPHLTIPIIHVAGTNGKGSVCAYIESILLHSGLRVGKFTSPHLVRVRDCISLGGKSISQNKYERIKSLVDRTNLENKIEASEFEKLTAVAFQAFNDEGRETTEPPATPLDVAVVEVGMGGSTDATNVCPTPLVSIITSIDLDHQAFLGDTVAEIAAVKAGIVKPGRPCIIAPQNYLEAASEIKSVAKRAGASSVAEVKPARLLDQQTRLAEFHLQAGATIRARLPLPGKYQLDNAATAVQAIDLLRQTRRDESSGLPEQVARRITDKAIVQGIEATRWPGRLDWVNFPHSAGLKPGRSVLVDGAHNPASITALQEYLESLPSVQEGGYTTLILALSAPRDPFALLGPLLSTSTLGKTRVVALPFSAPEGMPWVKPVAPGTIVAAAKQHELRADEASSLLAALQASDDAERTIICGSLYLVADVYRLLEQVGESAS